MQVLDASSCSMNVDGAVIEDATKHRLVHLHGFNFVHVHLESVPAYEPGLVNHPSVRDNEFSYSASERLPREPDRGHNDSDYPALKLTMRPTMAIATGQAKTTQCRCPSAMTASPGCITDRA
jgi:hypothetical protein